MTTVDGPVDCSGWGVPPRGRSMVFVKRVEPRAQVFVGPRMVLCPVERVPQLADTYSRRFHETPDLDCQANRVAADWF